MGILEFALSLIGVSIVIAILLFVTNAKVMEQIFGNYFVAGFALACIIGMIYKGLLTGHVSR